MATKPQLLILDSPTVGVDISAKDGIYEIVKALAAAGVAVILISDEIPEVLYHTHRMLMMRAGRLDRRLRAAPDLGGRAEGGGRCLRPSSRLGRSARGRGSSR